MACYRDGQKDNGKPPFFKLNLGICAALVLFRCQSLRPDPTRLIRQDVVVMHVLHAVDHETVGVGQILFPRHFDPLLMRWLLPFSPKVAVVAPEQQRAAGTGDVCHDQHRLIRRIRVDVENPHAFECPIVDTYRVESV